MFLSETNFLFLLSCFEDISMQGLMMIYDNEKQQLGWVSSDCNKLPKT